MNITNLERDLLLKIENHQRRLSVLTDFINNIYIAEDLPKNEAKKNLESAIVEIVYENNQHAANGILITTDGYFVTNLHCVVGPDRRKIILHNGECFSINKICARSKIYDLALVKADIPVVSEAIKYPFYIDIKLAQAMNHKANMIIVLTRWQKKLKIAGGVTDGKIKENSYTENGGNYKKQVHILSDLGPGYSGGAVILSLENKIYGINSNSNESGKSGFCTQWYNVVELISKYIEHHKNKTGFK